MSKVVGHCGSPVVGTAAQSGFVFPEFDKCQNIQRVVRSQIQSKFEYIKRGRASIGGTMLNLVHTPPTKYGKRVMFLTLEDETGLFDVVVFSKAQSRFAKLIVTSEVLTIEGRLQRKGPGGRSVSIVMSRASTGLSGSLAKLLANEMKISLLPKYRNLGPPGNNISIHERTGNESSEQLGLRY